MKTSRLPVFLMALLLVAALPAAADMRGIPASEGHPQATIEGTITSVNIPIAGGGPIVTLLGGLVSFDATDATVRYVNGREGTTDTLKAGQRILAILDPETSPLLATTVVIFSDRADVTFTGKIESTDVAAGTLKILGFTVTVTDETVFGGPWDGASEKGLEDVKVGDLALVDAKDVSGTLVATKVMKVSPADSQMLRLHGVVGSVGTESWTIVAADDTTTVVKVGTETKFNGDPKVGDTVDVLARRQSDGSLLAILIMKSVLPPTVETERFNGTVKAISTTSLTVGPKAGNRPDRLFTVNGETQLVGAPKVGDDVSVLARKQADGSWLALVVAKTATAGPTRMEVAFDGVVKSVAASPLKASWVVGTTEVFVTPMTRVKGDPRVGDTVHVEGLKSSDGSVWAKSIEKR